MSFAPKILLVPTALLALAVAAHAQSSATSFGSHDFSFSVDPNSVGSASDLTITDNGEEVYNLIVTPDPTNLGPYFSPYTAMTGSGVATAETDPTGYYDSTNQVGHSGIDSAANVPTFGGTADASVGAQRNLVFENMGTDDITLDVTSLVRATGTANATGASSATNFANVSTYAGVEEFDLTTPASLGARYIKTSGTDATGVSTSTPNNDYAPTFINGDLYYLGNFTYTFSPGIQYQLGFYASSVDHASANPVPEPSAFAALGLGALALVRRRRR